MSISLHSIKKGMFIEIGGDPHQVVEASFLRMQQRKPVVQAKIKNLINGKTIEKSFKPSDTIKEVEIERSDAQLFYKTKDTVFFKEGEDKTEFKIEDIKDKLKFITKNTPITLIKCKGRVIEIELPPKVELKVMTAPDGVRGDTSQGKVTKAAEMETGLNVNVPLFVNEGDVIRVSTESGDYVERV